MLKRYWALIGKRLDTYVQGKWPEYTAALGSALGMSVGLPSPWLGSDTNPALLVGTTAYTSRPDVEDRDGKAAVAAAEAIIHHHQTSAHR